VLPTLLLALHQITLVTHLARGQHGVISSVQGQEGHNLRMQASIRPSHRCLMHSDSEGKQLEIVKGFGFRTLWLLWFAQGLYSQWQGRLPSAQSAQQVPCTWNLQPRSWRRSAGLPVSERPNPAHSAHHCSQPGRQGRWRLRQLACCRPLSIPVSAPLLGTRTHGYSTFSP
jgi:hypothetical protein